MRQIVTGRRIAMAKAKAPEAEKAEIIPDTYKEKLLKLIPAEVVALYVVLVGVVSGAGTGVPTVQIAWFIFGVGILATILHLWRIEKVDAWSQIFISAGAFVVWVFALGGPFETLSWYNPVYGAILLVLYTFFVPMFTGK